MDLEIIKWMAEGAFLIISMVVGYTRVITSMESGQAALTNEVKASREFFTAEVASLKKVLQQDINFLKNNAQERHDAITNELAISRDSREKLYNRIRQLDGELRERLVRLETKASITWHGVKKSD